MAGDSAERKDLLCMTEKFMVRAAEAADYVEKGRYISRRDNVKLEMPLADLMSMANRFIATMPYGNEIDAQDEVAADLPVGIPG